MTYIVAKVRAFEPEMIADLETLAINQDIAKAANNLGAWKGEVFAVWDWPEGTNSKAQAAEYARDRSPDSAVVVAINGQLLTVHQGVTMDIRTTQ
jgi:hypothetical protein